MPSITVPLLACRTVQAGKALIDALARETPRGRSLGSDAMQIVIGEAQKYNRRTRGVPASAIFPGPPGSRVPAIRATGSRLDGRRRG